MKWFSAFFCLGVTLLLSVANPAWGHAIPKEYDPKPDAIVHSVSTISIIFGEELEPTFSTLLVLNDKKQKIATGTVDPTNSKKLILKTPPLKKGHYHVQWVAVARDGHKTHGEYAFKIK